MIGRRERSHPATPGRRFAYAGAALGASVSIAGNVADVYYRADGDPKIGAVAAGACWPVAVLLALEIMARVPWPARPAWRGVTLWSIPRWGGLTPVALGAAVISYRHLSNLLGVAYGEDRITATLGPLVWDGLMVLSLAALIATTPHRMAEVAEVAEAEADPAVRVTMTEDKPATWPTSLPVAAPTPEAMAEMAASTRPLAEADMTAAVASATQWPTPADRERQAWIESGRAADWPAEWFAEGLARWPTWTAKDYRELTGLAERTVGRRLRAAREIRPPARVVPIHREETNR